MSLFNNLLQYILACKGKAIMFPYMLRMNNNDVINTKIYIKID